MVETFSGQPNNVAAIRGTQITGGLQMLGDQRCVLVQRVRVTLLDRGRQPPVQLRTIGFELRFVGHRADQRMMKFILGLAGEPHLIDKLAHDQIINGGFDTRGGQQVKAESRADYRRRAQCSLSRRIEAVDARGDGGLQRRRNTNLGDLCRR